MNNKTLKIYELSKFFVQTDFSFFNCYFISLENTMTDKDLLNLILEDSKTEYLQQKHDEWEQRQFDKNDISDWQDNGVHSVGPVGIKTQNLDNIYAGYKNKNQVEPEETEADKERKEKELKTVNFLIPELEKNVSIALGDKLYDDEKDYKHVKDLLSEYIKLLKQIQHGGLNVKFRSSEYNKIKDRERAELDYKLSDIANNQLKQYVNDPRFSELLNSFRDVHNTISKMSFFKGYNPNELSVSKQNGFREAFLAMLLGLNFKLHSDKLLPLEAALSNIEKKEKIIDFVQKTDFNNLIEYSDNQHKKLNGMKYGMLNLLNNKYDGKEIWNYYLDLKKNIEIENIPITITEAEGTLSLKLDPDRKERIMARWNQEAADLEARSQNKKVIKVSTHELFIQERILESYLKNSPITDEQTKQASKFVETYLLPSKLIKNISIAYNSFNSSVSDEVKNQFSDLDRLQKEANKFQLTEVDKEQCENLAKLMILYLDEDLKAIKDLKHAYEVAKNSENKALGRL